MSSRSFLTLYRKKSIIFIYYKYQRIKINRGFQAKIDYIWLVFLAGVTYHKTNTMLLILS